MSPSAQRVHIDFTRFAGEEAASLYFDELLVNGTSRWPDSLRLRFPHLSKWKGIEHLKGGIKTLAGALPDSQLLLANRSAQLMKLAAKLLFGPCRNVLVTDLNWPNYQALLQREATRGANRITCVRLRTGLLSRRIDEADALGILTETFVRRRCDGLFLPLVDNLGVHLPIERITRELDARGRLRFVVVDGSQAFCHVPVTLAHEYCDFFIAGTHKWLGAYHPLGLGFYGHRRSAKYIDRTRRRLTASGKLDDPLLKLIEEIEMRSSESFGETVSLSPLFSCQGAVDDALQNKQELHSTVRQRIKNSDALALLMAAHGWRPLFPPTQFRSGIALFQSSCQKIRAAPPTLVREAFHGKGIAVTTYSKGIIRLAMPATPLDPNSKRLLAISVAQFSREI